MPIAEWQFGPAFVPEYKRRDLSEAEKELLRRILDETLLSVEVDKILAPVAAELGSFESDIDEAAH